MRVLKAYFDYIDSGLASLRGADAREGLSWNDGLINLIYAPMLMMALPTVMPAVVLGMFGLSAVWRAVFGIAFVTVAAIYYLTVFWRWSIFDYEDYTGTKPPNRFGDFG